MLYYLINRLRMDLQREKTWLCLSCLPWEKSRFAQSRKLEPSSSSLITSKLPAASKHEIYQIIALIYSIWVWEHATKNMSCPFNKEEQKEILLFCSHLCSFTHCNPSYISIFINGASSSCLVNWIESCVSACVCTVEGLGEYAYSCKHGYNLISETSSEYDSQTTIQFLKDCICSASWWFSTEVKASGAV